VAPNQISTATHEQLTQEILTLGGPDRFRIYPIQGSWEPHTHFLLHTEANRDTNTSSSTDEFFYSTTSQLGYGYGRSTRSLKAPPLNDFPLVAQLAVTIEEMACHHDISSTKTASTTETYWNIGANGVCYRDGRNHIGLHPDNDQGENVIFTVIAQSSYSWHIVIQSNNKDVLYELFLRARDGYCLDGVMQQHFLHGLPAVKSQQYQNKLRIVDFRRGQQKMIKRDTGQPVTSLEPHTPLPPRLFGHLVGMQEGHVYTMKQLKELNAHSNAQAGVSGNKTEGCDSIVISHKQQGPSDDEQDSLLEFSYTGSSTTLVGFDLIRALPVRAVCSSKLTASVFCALMPHGKSTTTVYRFDGLYYPTFLHEEPCDRPTKPSYQMYRLVRSPCGNDAKTTALVIVLAKLHNFRINEANAATINTWHDTYYCCRGTSR
jgi:hypothetical protein